MKKILFISHRKAQCGVYEFGKSITDVLQNSKKYQFIRVECSSLSELHNAINENSPSAIIYNYYPSVMPWLATKIAPRLWKSNIASISIPQIGIIHEISQQVADNANNYRNKFLVNGYPHLINSLFDYYIAPDPTLLMQNPYVYKTGRLIPYYQNKFELSSIPIIGSFGFGTPNKGFERIVEFVQNEFDNAIIRFNIPSADFGLDKDGSNARAIAKRCNELNKKSEIQLIITHDFLSKEAMLDFLAQNTVNVFLYENDKTIIRGLSSTIENAMAVQRPIAVSDDAMFRHILNANPSVCIKENNLKTIIQNGFSPLQKLYSEWSAENLLWDYERIMDSIFFKQHSNSKQRSFLGTLKYYWNKTLLKPEKTFSWLINSEEAAADRLQIDNTIQYHPVQNDNVHFNRILDNNARELYKPAIDKLMELVPKTMSKKIAEANVQQAFVFDTIHRYLPQYNNPKILCVGAYQDTASMSLIRMGYTVEEIDPTLNYSLQEYFYKPSTQQNSYDIIFSTSVIEHDPDDELFVKCIADLLAPGGIAIITCDYKDGWISGEPKPECDVRFYTQYDLKYRLLPLMNNCELIDEPHWDCPYPDFIYLGRYRYTFATFTIKKLP